LTFLKGLEGKIEVGGGMASCQLAREWLYSDESTVSRKGMLCVLFLLKPVLFILYGQPSSGKGDGKELAEMYAEFLPFLNQDDIDSLSEDRQSFNEFKRARRLFPDAYQNMNLTRTRMAAFWYLSTAAKDSDNLVSYWYSTYGVSPHKMDRDNRFFKEIGGRDRESIIAARWNMVTKIAQLIESV
jgi:hypothetical protein